MPAGGVGPKPDSGLVWAILVTFLCCMPAGIVAIVYAAKVDSLWFAGQHAQAAEAAAKSKRWSAGSAIATGVFLALYLAVVLVATAAGSAR